MKRLVLLITVILCMSVAFPDQIVKAQVDVGGLCRDYTSDFGTTWDVEVGIGGGPFVGSQVRISNNDQVVRASVYNPVGGTDSRMSDVWIHAFGADGLNAHYPNVNNYHFQIKLYSNNIVVFDTSYDLYADDIQGTIRRHIAIPDVPADRIWVEIYQPTNSPGNLSTPIAFQVERVCAKSSLPTPTYTPSPTFPPPTAPPGPTNTPYPTITPLPPTPTRTSTSTRTPTITRTPTKTRTPQPTRTNTPIPPSNTPGGPTDTPLPPTFTPGGPTDTPPPSDTPEPPEPTETFQSTLVDYLPLTPIPPDDECTDINNPCRPFAMSTFAPPNIPSPTAIALLGTLTPLPSMTRVNLQTAFPSEGGTPALPVQFLPVIENLSNSLDSLESIDSTMRDGNGQYVSTTNALYSAGENIGNLWMIVRSITESDLGPQSVLLVFLLSMIGLNIGLRILLFVLAVVLGLLKTFPQATTIVIVILVLFTVAALFNLFNLASETTATPQPTATLITPTTTGTLLPINPTATSKYEGFRATPSPWPTSHGTDLPLNNDEHAGEMADNVINTYRFANQNGWVDLLSFLMIGVTCLAVAIRVQRSLTRDKM